MAVDAGLTVLTIQSARNVPFEVMTRFTRLRVFSIARTSVPVMMRTPRYAPTEADHVAVE